jgi:hypothetical protein
MQPDRAGRLGRDIFGSGRFEFAVELLRPLLRLGNRQESRVDNMCRQKRFIRRNLHEVLLGIQPALNGRDLWVDASASI